jgi:hypothetical protein
VICDGSGIMPASADREALRGRCYVCDDEVDLEPLGDTPDVDAVLVTVEHRR